MKKPHPEPQQEPIEPFAHSYDGVHDCGPQIISIVPQTLEFGTLSDFVSIVDDETGSFVNVAPTNVE